ncbi:MAG: pyridoxamine 5'-phosphate oxidase family protein [Nitrospirae bacterium]|nr:pyridoxamine 5'-phosphate oxidase family protein [Nitrospirota bacterium]
MITKKTKSVSKAIPVTVKQGSEDVPGRLAVLNRKQPHAVLATASDNEPYTSLVAFAVTPDMKGLVFATPRKTKKFSNIAKNRNVSLLIDTRSNTAGDYMKTELISISGSAKVIRQGAGRDELAEIFTNKHPRLRAFVNASSTALILVKISKCIHVSSFQVVSEYSW